MTEETQKAERTPEELERERIKAAAQFEKDVMTIMRWTSVRTLMAARDHMPEDDRIYRGIINARLRILRGLD